MCKKCGRQHQKFKNGRTKKTCSHVLARQRVQQSGEGVWEDANQIAWRAVKKYGKKYLKMMSKK